MLETALEITQTNMGLEMSVARRHYVSRLKYEAPEDVYTVEVRRGGKPLADINSDRISVIEETVMTWWKASHIHAWFVKNLQLGHDDCKLYVLDLDTLDYLREDCEKVLNGSQLGKAIMVTEKEYNQKTGLRETQRVPVRLIVDTTTAQAIMPVPAAHLYRMPCYDEHYLMEVQRTKDWIEREIENDRKMTTCREYYYSSSW